MWKSVQNFLWIHQRLDPKLLYMTSCWPCYTIGPKHSFKILVFRSMNTASLIQIFNIKLKFLTQNKNFLIFTISKTAED